MPAGKGNPMTRKERIDATVGIALAALLIFGPYVQAWWNQ